MTKYSTDYFVFAENVLPGDNGKQTIVNIFKEIYAPALPIVQPLLSLAINIDFSGTPPKTGSILNITLKVKDPSGEIIGDSIVSNLNITDEDKSGITFGIGANGMPINAYGNYTFEICIDEKVVASRVLTVKEVK